eukprot:3247202-Prymnesium_polylepis.1
MGGSAAPTVRAGVPGAAGLLLSLLVFAVGHAARALAVLLLPALRLLGWRAHWHAAVRLLAVPLELVGLPKFSCAASLKIVVLGGGSAPPPRLEPVARACVDRLAPPRTAPPSDAHAQPMCDRAVKFDRAV